METELYMTESMWLLKKIKSIREEITNAIKTAEIKHAYDKDIQLSFGLVHINKKGSVSRIRFEGKDVTDIDSFAIMQALQINKDNYYDIRNEIKNFPQEFCFYPIKINGKLHFTVLKNSPYFNRKYFNRIDNDETRVFYAAKYLVYYHTKSEKPDIFLIGIYNANSTAKLLLENAGKNLGGKANIFYCFSNSRPELFLHLGQIKSDFEAYHPEKYPKSFNFYRGSIISGIFRINKAVDNNGKIKVNETIKNSLQLIIRIQFGNVTSFCNYNNVNCLSMNAYLAGNNIKIKYNNGDEITPRRLLELLNLPFMPDAQSLKNNKLMVRVNYDEIPS